MGISSEDSRKALGSTRVCAAGEVCEIGKRCWRSHWLACDSWEAGVGGARAHGSEYEGQ